ncbi:MAG: GLUG motif-containing protein [Thermoplasmata archaeon]
MMGKVCAVFFVVCTLAVASGGVGNLRRIEIESHTFGEGSGTLDDPHMIYDVHDLQAMRNNLSAHYALANDIDANVTKEWNDGAGFEPVGNYDYQFSGRLDGNGYEITGLYINRPDSRYIGLFGRTDNSEINEVRMIDAKITGDNGVGGLVGSNEGGSINNSYTAGHIVGRFWVGGLVGLSTGVISNAHSEANIEGSSRLGGLAGRNDGSISDSYAVGGVSGNHYIGGLVGFNWGGTVLRSYATGNVDGTGDDVGGFVGWNEEGTLSKCYATGEVIGVSNSGGFVGLNVGSVFDSYSRGNVTRTSGDATSFGGFVGFNQGMNITNSYSTGRVLYDGASDPYENGFAGKVDGDYQMVGNFWDSETSYQTETAGNATRKITAEMQNKSTFTDVGWDFQEIWCIIENVTYPLLQWQDTPVVRSVELNLYAFPESGGWNFISFNISPKDTSIAYLLADIEGNYDRVLYYDASIEDWLVYSPNRPENFNSLHNLEYTMGFWIRMLKDDLLTMEGIEPTSTDIALYPGWNMVGVPSESEGNHGLPGEVTKIGYFDTNGEYNVSYDYDAGNFTFSPGQGYMVYNGEDYAVKWTVDY